MVQCPQANEAGVFGLRVQSSPDSRLSYTLSILLLRLISSPAVDLLPIAGVCEVGRQVKGGSPGIWLWGVCGGGGGSER